MSILYQQGVSVVLSALHEVIGEPASAPSSSLSPGDLTLLAQPLASMLKDDLTRTQFVSLVNRNLSALSISFNPDEIGFLVREAFLVATANDLIGRLVSLLRGPASEVSYGAPAHPPDRSVSPPFVVEELQTGKSAETKTRIVVSSPPAMAPSPSIFQSVNTRPSSGPVASVTDNASIVQVFYATDRALTSPPEDPPTFGVARSPGGQLNYGVCNISIPKIHERGKVERPFSILGFEFRPNPAKHIVLDSIVSEDDSVFFAHVANRVARTPNNEAFVFIHGYRVSFEDAALRAGQIAFDLSFDGAPIFYSWPSQGKVDRYTVDETNVRWSAPHLQQFLVNLHLYSGAQRIHVLAHSMGNRAVCEALQSISLDPACQLRIHNLILAAPDEDADTFGALVKKFAKVAGRITLYQSSKDKAIAISKTIHGNLRAGEPLLVIPGVDTIDVSSIDTDFLGHSYFSDNPQLLADIRELIFYGAAPPRFNLEALTNILGPYYSFKA